MDKVLASVLFLAVLGGIWFGLWQSSLFAGVFMIIALVVVGVPLWAIAMVLDKDE